MKSLISRIAVLMLLCYLASEIRANNFEIGTKFPVEKLTQDKSPADNRIVVFIPSLTYDCEYASMLTQSFYYYFDQQMAFEDSKKKPNVRIFLIVKDRQDESKSMQNIIGGMNVIFDEKGELFSFFGVDAPSDKNSDSTIFLLDSNNVVAHIDKNYRAQGEHLKPLENKLKGLNGINKAVKYSTSQKILKIGDRAPDFWIDEKKKLSDLRGNVILISFYPAAFSGTLPKPNLLNTSQSDSPFSAEKLNIVSCSYQISSLDLKFKSPKQPKRIVITTSTNSLLKKWQEILGTQNIEYTNDAEYSVSSKYFSYNPNGYNNRVSVIVDQKGNIAYIDKDFDFKDEAILNARIEKLLKSK